MLGAAIAAREGKLLTLATGEFLPKGRISAVAHVFAGAIGAMIATMLDDGRRSCSSRAIAGRRQITPRRAEVDRRSRAADRLRPDRAAARLARLAASGRARASPRWASSRACVLNQYRARPSMDQSLLPWFALVLAAGVLGAPIFALLGGIALFASLSRGNPPAVLPLMAYQELTTSTGHRRHSAVHARRLPARGREIVGAAAARLPRLGRLGCRRHGHRRRDAVRVLHALHRRIGRHDPRARRPAAAGARRQRVSRALLDRPADRVRIARPALPALAAADALRHRLAEGVDRGSVHRRAAAGTADARTARGAGRPRRLRSGAAQSHVRLARGARGVVGGAKWELLLPGLRRRLVRRRRSRRSSSRRRSPRSTP